jgi:hypothetical protein
VTIAYITAKQSYKLIITKILLHHSLTLYFRVLKNISNYIPPNAKTGKACIVKECKMLYLVVFTFSPRETEGTLVTMAIYRPDLQYSTYCIKWEC